MDWGGATGQSSPAAAAAAAVKACDAKGEGKDCGIAEAAFNSGCQAVSIRISVFDSSYWGSGAGRNEAEARSAAISDCGQKDCKVELVICAKPG
jgi:hypothetical protein